MKVDPSIGKISSPAVGSPVATNKAAPVASPPAAASTVQMSSQLRTLEQQISRSESFNADKVNAIKAAIAEGRFQVDSGKIADGLIRTARDLVSAQNTPR